MDGDSIFFCLCLCFVGVCVICIKVLGKVDGGKKTINFPFDFVTKSSICFSDTLLFGKFANINSSVLFDLGHLSFFNLSAEPRTI
jgi:hypothetical protein